MVKIEDDKLKAENTSQQDKRKSIVTGGYTKFEGRIKELKGYMFDTDPRNVNCYIICKEEIARNVRASYDHGDLIASVIRNFKTSKLERPKDPG
eukprot:12087883-Ditylum_brightwellii.AAC.1